MTGKTRRVAVIVGSLRKDANSRKIADCIMAQAPGNWATEEVVIADLPLYNQDSDTESVTSYERVRVQLAAADAVLFVSPEHNRSVPAALKNVVDIASRPWGKSVWTGKKTALVTSSTGVYGGISAGIHLRQILQMTAANVLIGPEVYLSRFGDDLDADGKLSNERTIAFLKTFAAGFEAWLAESV